MTGIKRIFICAVVLTAGCASSSEALRVGPDTYSITASASGVGGDILGAQRKAQEDAAKHCAKSGTKSWLIDQKLIARGRGAEAVVTFKCLSKDSPELTKQ